MRSIKFRDAYKPARYNDGGSIITGRRTEEPIQEGKAGAQRWWWLPELSFNGRRTNNLAVNPSSRRTCSTLEPLLKCS